MISHHSGFPQAYSVFDEEIGYVQGLSFITAVLLIQLPEESAFVLYVNMMQNYGLRDLFMAGFENLKLRLYQVYFTRLSDSTHVKMDLMTFHLSLSMYVVRPLYRGAATGPSRPF